MFEGTEKILVIKLRHIGDVLLTVPAIRALKESFPGSSVTALVNSGTEDMLTLNPLLDEVVAFNRSVKNLSITGRISGELRLVRRLREKGFDMAVDLTGGDRPALISFLSGARYRLGYDPRGSGFAGKKLLYTHVAERPSVRTHTVLRDLGLLKEFGISTGDLTVDIYTSPEDDSHIERVLKENGLAEGRFFHAHPTSRWLFKCWTDAGMAYVMDELDKRGFRPVITTGPDDKELKKARSIMGLMKSPYVDLSGKLKLKHLAALSRRAAFFLGVDSAPMHIAAAAGSKVFGIFGPSGAFDWGPWDNHGVKQYGVRSEKGLACSPYPGRNGVQRFGGDTVIQLDWDCIPCGKDGCGGSKKSDCLDKLEPGVVLDTVLEEIKAGACNRIQR